MKCPYCTSNDTRVINSRPSDEGASIRRRRDCENCHRRFTTYERAQFEALMVTKRSGRREPFTPDKLLDKLRIACNKRPVTEKQLREYAYGFEDEVQVPEIASDEIGMRTLKFLKELDDVAYIRFLSVYRDFDSVDRFIDEIKQLGELTGGKQTENTGTAGSRNGSGQGESKGSEGAVSDAESDDDAKEGDAGTRPRSEKVKPSASGIQPSLLEGASGEDRSDD